MVATNRAFPAPHEIDYTDRAWYRHHRDGGAQPLVSEYLTSRATGEPFFDVSMRRSLPDGSFGGTVSTSLRPDYFQHFYRQLIGDDEKVAVAMLRNDGAVIASWPATPLASDAGAGTRWAVNAVGAGHAASAARRRRGLPDRPAGARLPGARGRVDGVAGRARAVVRADRAGRGARCCRSRPASSS